MENPERGLSTGGVRQGVARPLGVRLGRQGTTAIEFAIIGPALILLVLGILLIATAQFWQMTLDDAVRAATRQVQIGAITTGPAFVTAVCREVAISNGNCTNNLQYAVQSASSFGAIVPATVSHGQLSIYEGSALFSAKLSTPVIGSNPASPQFLLVQVVYPLPSVFGLVGAAVTGNGSTSLISADSTEMEYSQN